MQLIVLGSAASYPDAGRACAGYLVRSGSTSVLMDCGNGVISNLGKVMDPTRLDAVVITHSHIDHFADVYALQAALRYAPDGPAAPLPLHLPEGLFGHMGAALDEHGALELAEAFEVHEIAPGVPIEVGDITLTPVPVDHVEPTFALVVTDGEAQLTYTSDTRAGEAVACAVAGSTLVLAEATLPPEFAGRAPHMTPAEAAEVAAAAGADTLVLTHMWPTVDRAHARTQARARFGGRVMVADELDTFDI